MTDIFRNRVVRKGKGGEMVLFHLVSVEAGGGGGERASLPVAWFLSSLEHVPDLKVLSSLIQWVCLRSHRSSWCKWLCSTLSSSLLQGVAGVFCLLKQHPRASPRSRLAPMCAPVHDPLPCTGVSIGGNTICTVCSDPRICPPPILLCLGITRHETLGLGFLAMLEAITSLPPGLWPAHSQASMSVLCGCSLPRTPMSGPWSAPPRLVW